MGKSVLEHSKSLNFPGTNHAVEPPRLIPHVTLNILPLCQQSAETVMKNTGWVLDKAEASSEDDGDSDGDETE